jgi:predicted transcriptional regulator
MIHELLETKRIISTFDKAILNSPYKTEYISSRANIPLPTFYRKLRENKFSLDEVIAIAKIIEPEQFEYEMLSKKIAIAEEQFRNGQFIKYEDFVFSAKKILADRK